MKKTIFFLSILVFSNIGAVIAQNDFKKHDKWITHYPSNVEAPFSNDELIKLEAAYGDELQNQILRRPIRVKDIKDILRNRVFIYQENIKDLSKTPLLSEITIFNIYNHKSNRPIFRENDFNPLLYNLNFFSKVKQTYRVDNTNYLIVIKPRELK
ncbi:MAG TPA: hypothetical protein QGI27_06555 [Flavobacteriaceae bacterium]|nr:hypothetical protein [Flavobacteriaceae bacterium]